MRLPYWQQGAEEGSGQGQTRAQEPVHPPLQGSCQPKLGADPEPDTPRAKGWPSAGLKWPDGRLPRSCPISPLDDPLLCLSLSLRYIASLSSNGTWSPRSRTISSRFAPFPPPDSRRPAKGHWKHSEGFLAICQKDRGLGRSHVGSVDQQDPRVLEPLPDSDRPAAQHPLAVMPAGTVSPRSGAASRL